jgi:hypothetical protein
MADAFAGESPREHRHDLRAGRREEHDVDAVQVELAAEQVAAPCHFVEHAPFRLPELLVVQAVPRYRSRR